MTAPLDFWIHVLDPMRAEVRLRLQRPGSQLQGRLMGPRSRFTSTIEIALPFRSVKPPLEFAAVVPEPSLWSPAKPFVYEGPVEWIDTDGSKCSTWLRLGFRRLQAGPKGLLLNGKQLEIKGKELSLRGESSPEEKENELLELRGQGFNALLPAAGQDIAELADRLGFLLVLREPGDSCQESYRCVADGISGSVGLPGIVRQPDGSFTLDFA